MSKGEQRVALGRPEPWTQAIREARVATANLIDMALEALESSTDPEVKRVAALAATSYEDACLWLEKALSA